MNNKIKIHQIEGYISNLFLIEYPEKLLLLDSGSLSDVKRIENFCLNTLKRPVSDIKLVFVSHMHPDHAGGALMFRRIHNLPIAAFYRADLWYRGITGCIQHRLDCFMAQSVRKQNKKPLEKVRYNKRVKPDILLKDNDTLPGFEDWQVLHVPGHTTHDIVVLNKKEKILYGADCIINVNSKLNLPIPVFFKETMKNSFIRLRSLDIDTILLAHGDRIYGNLEEIFNTMICLLDKPHNRLRRRTHRISTFAPDVWAAGMKKKLRSIISL